MKKWIWLIGLLFLVLIAALVVSAGVHEAQRRDPASVKFYFRSKVPRELPTDLIRPAFRLVTEEDLPSRADNLRAIAHGGRVLNPARGPHVFIEDQRNHIYVYAFH